jgi:hypothetical protein
MLATWMRMKFPEIVSAAVASGAPILYFKDSQVPEPIFFQWIGKIYGEMGKLENGKCSSLITEALGEL